MEWKEVRLGDIAFFKTGKLNSNAACKNGKYPFFTCSPETLAIDSYAFDQKAILLAGNNAEGNFSIKYYEGKFNAYQRTYVISATDNIDLLFLYYSMKLCLSSFKKMSQGSATKFLTTVILNNFQIRIPSTFQNQRCIANILYSLDRKIELNNKINAQLEEMAQTLFKHWLLECKEDITIGELSYNINDYSKCGNPKVVLVNSSDVTEGFFDHHNYTENKDLKGHFKKRFQKGDILYSQVRPRNRHWAYCDFYADDYIASTQLMIIRNREEIIPSIVLYHYIVSDDVWKEFTSRTETRSGTFPQGNYEEISTIKVPFGAEMKDISINLEVIHSKMYNNNQENIKLASLRDTLLPKLMSGEINLEDYGGE